MCCYHAMSNNNIYQPPGAYLVQWPISFPNSDPPRWFDINITDAAGYGIPSISAWEIGYQILTNQYAVYAYGVGY